MPSGYPTQHRRTSMKDARIRDLHRITHWVRTCFKSGHIPLSKCVRKHHCDYYRKAA